MAATAGIGVSTMLSACTPHSSSSATTEALPTGFLGPLPTASPGPQILPIDPSMPTFGRPSGPIYALPTTSGNPIAWTVDDGFSSDVVTDYAVFAKTTGARITFFMCGKARGWANAAEILRPMVESGQVQIANHTHNHVRMVDASDDLIRQELMTNHDVIASLFGVDARPYFRPPFGLYDERVARAAASVGYTVPVLWNGTLSDAGEIDPQLIFDFANRYMNAGTILLGHANYWPVTTIFSDLVRLLDDRNLSTVTLNDVYRA